MNATKPITQTNVIDRDLLADVVDRWEADVMAPQAPTPAADTKETKARYRAKERKRQAKLREELEVSLPASVIVADRDGWRNDPKYVGMAYHPVHGYVRYMANHGLEKKGGIPLTVYGGSARYEFRHQGRKVKRYVESLQYDTGFSDWNPYIALRRR